MASDSRMVMGALLIGDPGMLALVQGLEAGLQEIVAVVPPQHVQSLLGLLHRAGHLRARRAEPRRDRQFLLLRTLVYGTLPPAHVRLLPLRCPVAVRVHGCTGFVIASVAHR